ncbi:MAG: TonB-dependent receptor [Prevotellaceae bacterium]|jgi:outer membrane receptor for ferrienterochelin and colicins|nr:TonB-dependent receptor [Prevotellaceae bacterium]
MKKIYTLIVVLLIVFIGQISARTIKGYVYDSEKKPIPNVSISIAGGSQNVLTDNTGFFTIAAADNDYLIAECLGYQENRVKVNGSEHIAIELKEEENFLNTVVVTGTRTTRTLKNTPVLTKVVSSLELKDMGAVTALDALESLLPGVHFDPNPMGDNIQIQGLGNAYILVLIDGERIAPETNENVNFSRLNVAEIERIEILNGASSVLYGSNAIGGVINIITKKIGQPLEGFVQGRYSKFNTYNADASLGFKVASLTSKTGLNFKTTDGYDLTPETPQSYTVRPNTDYTLTQSLRYELSKKLSADLNGRFFSHETENPPLSVSTTHKLVRDYTFGGKVNYAMSEKNVLTASGHSDIYKSYTVLEKKSNDKELGSDYKYTSARLLDAWTPSDKIQVVGGVEFNHEKMFSENLFGNIGRDESSHNTNLFVQGDFKIVKNLEGVIGARYTNHSGFGSHFSPKTSLMYKLGSFRFRAGISNGFKTPTLKEMYYNFDHQGMFQVIGNPDLKPEESWYKSFSVEFLNETVNISASFYHNSINDKINTVQYNIEDPSGNETYEMRYENVADARILGVDVFAQYNFLKHFSFKGGYAYADAIDKEDDTQISGNSKHNITSAFSFRFNKLKIGSRYFPFVLSFSGRYSSPRIYETVTTDASGSSITTSANSSAYSLWRFTYTQRIPIAGRWSFEVQGSVDNIFDNVDNATFINPGRTFSILAKISF